MTLLLDKKIQEFKLRAGPVMYSEVPVQERGKRANTFLEDLDNRIISGYLLVWGSVNMHGEMFLRGCCAKSIAERGPDSKANYKITFLNQHIIEEPLCVFAELVEDDFGLFFRSKPLDNVPWADNVLVQVRSGTLNQFSAGFNFIWDKVEWDEQNDCIVGKEIDLFEGSIVTIGSELNTRVVRSAEQRSDFYEEIESFIKVLPRKHQLQARQYITKLKSLVTEEPLPDKETLEKRKKPANEKGINYQFLINNL